MSIERAEFGKIPINEKFNRFDFDPRYLRYTWYTVRQHQRHAPPQPFLPGMCYNSRLDGGIVFRGIFRKRPIKEGKMGRQKQVLYVRCGRVLSSFLGFHSCFFFGDGIAHLPVHAILTACRKSLYAGPSDIIHTRQVSVNMGFCCTGAAPPPPPPGLYQGSVSNNIRPNSKTIISSNSTAVALPQHRSSIAATQH